MRGIRARLPAGVADCLGVLRGEKIIAWGSVADDTTYVVATSRAVYLPVEGRVPWHRVSRASWTEPVLDMVLLDGVLLGGNSAPSGAISVRLDDARDLPPAVHDRVTNSVIVSERVELTQTAGARMVARRDSDDDSIHWSVVFDPGLDPREPALRAGADEALDRLRESLGI